MAVTPKIEYLTRIPGPRDIEHRRVAAVTDRRFTENETYMDESFAAIIAAIEALGGAVTLSSRGGK
jgi:hypothetical protein